MTKEQILAGTPFYCYNDKPVTIQHPGGKSFAYDGVFSLARLASPLTLNGETILDHRSEPFAELEQIREQYFVFFKKGYGRVMVLNQHLHAEPQNQKH